MADSPLCRAQLIGEPVVVTTYRLVCPVHGVVAVDLSYTEACESPVCLMPHAADG